MDYVTRNGQLDAITQDGDIISGKEEVRDLLDEWEIIDKGEGRGKKAFNVVLSMPAGTNTKKLFASIQDFARDEFWGKHKYMMVLHTPENDPNKKPSPNPHVHLIIKAEGERNRKERLYIRKATLEKWRTNFAEKLREHGIEANATPRDIRGKTRKSKSMSIYKTEKTGTSRVMKAKFEETIQELNQGKLSDNPWENPIKNKRKNVINLFMEVAKDFRNNGDNDFADRVEKYAKSLPKLETERHAIKASIIKRTNEKTKSLEKDIER